MRFNACELEIDLFCRGLRLPAETDLDSARPVSRTRAGLGSGLELAIPTGSRLKPEVWPKFRWPSDWRLYGRP